jgi:large repetitive protein
MKTALSLVFTALLIAAGPARAEHAITLPIGFSAPSGVAVDAGGNLFVADTGSNAVKEIPAAGGWPQGFAIGFANGNFNAPQGVAVDSSGNVFVADTGSNAIKEIVAASGYVTVQTLASGGVFVAPQGVAVDSSGNVFVADTRSSTVEEIVAAGGYTIVKSLAPGNFIAPTSIAIDPSGNLFVVDGALKELPALGGYATVQTIITTPSPSGPGNSFGLTGIAVDDNGNVFALEEEYFGSGFPTDYSLLESPAASGHTTTTTLSGPTASPYLAAGLAIDRSGNLFFAQNDGVAEALAAGGYATVDTIASGGIAAAAGVAVVSGGNLFVTDHYGAVDEAMPPAEYSSFESLAAGSLIKNPSLIAVDGAGDLFFSDSGYVKEVPAEGGYAASRTIADFDVEVDGIAIDSSGNVFVTTGNSVEEVLAADNYVTVEAIALENGNFNSPHGLAIDSSGNVFVADSGNNAIKEILAQGGYVAVETLPAAIGSPSSLDGLAIDGGGNLFVADAYNNAVEEISATSGYSTVTSLGEPGDFRGPTSVAVDRNGNVFVVDISFKVKEIAAPPSPLAAAILPGARSVEIGTTATVFASLLNAGSDTLSGCAPGLPATAPAGLTLDYAPTDPATNAVTGPPDQPVMIAAGGSQSFVLAFGDTAPLVLSGLAIQFDCAGVAPAPVTLGLDTVDLLFSAAPTPDIIAIAATTSPGLTVHIANQLGAFAVAAIDIGAPGALTAYVDTGMASLPLEIGLCPTDAGGQCLQPLTFNTEAPFTTNGTATFSVFMLSSGPIPFDPATSRIFVRFIDGDGVSHGSTSVAVTTD